MSKLIVCKIRHPKDNSRHPKDTSKHPKDKSKHPKDNSKHPKDNSRHPTDNSKHLTDKSRHQTPKHCEKIEDKLNKKCEVQPPLLVLVKLGQVEASVQQVRHRGSVDCRQAMEAEER